MAAMQPDTGEIFTDDFEVGNTLNWSSTAP